MIIFIIIITICKVHSAQSSKKLKSEALSLPYNKFLLNHSVLKN